MNRTMQKVFGMTSTTSFATSTGILPDLVAWAASVVRLARGGVRREFG